MKPDAATKVTAQTANYVPEHHKIVTKECKNRDALSELYDH